VTDLLHLFSIEVKLLSNILPRCFFWGGGSWAVYPRTCGTSQTPPPLFHSPTHTHTHTPPPPHFSPSLCSLPTYCDARIKGMCLLSSATVVTRVTADKAHYNQVFTTTKSSLQPSLHYNQVFTTTADKAHYNRVAPTTLYCLCIKYARLTADMAHCNEFSRTTALQYLCIYIYIYTHIHIYI
jgi:hypothetical protein